MAEGMILAGERLAGPPVDFVGSHPRFHQRNRCELRPTHRLDQSGLLGRRLTHHDRPGGVAVVAGGGRAEVDHHQVASLKDAVGRTAVREGTPFTGSHDGFEGRAVGPQLAEGLLQQEGDITLAQPRPDGRADAIERTAGDRRDRA